MIQSTPRSTLFPYTTLFRSQRHCEANTRWRGFLQMRAKAVDKGKALEAEDLGRGNGVFLVSARSEEHTSELQSQFHLVCRLLLVEKNRSWLWSSPFWIRSSK